MSQLALRPVLTAFGRALVSQFSGRMILLSAIPFFLSVALWSGLLYTGLQPLFDAIQAFFDANGLQEGNGVLGMLGLGFLKNVLVPLLAMLLLLPLMIVTAFIFMGVAAMPAIVRHVSARQYPQLEKKNGGSFIGSVKTNMGGMLVFLPIWLLTLPLYPLSVPVQVLLWGWLTAHVMSYDALADHASEEERQELKRRHRTPLMVIGIVSGVAGALPGLVWVGGTVLSVVLFPILAPLSIWIFVLIFIFTGLWFQYYCLQALQDLRAAGKQL
ncbi:EI24 domain-containing protein [Massilia sp. CF038]|uniref:EI24 domain-containing protein n=1 Tax=Massilia sp. CF038 TaxID=1881045 RepID=UPI00091ACBCF|nr:EI24 domain-containing protein [Massilia sp. CF038]SHH22007.1 Etoposide-induced protein 2.4 (EI24) [Massilia sp. CF038]